MKEYDFTLKFALRDGNADAEAFVEKLSDAGCDDALVGIGQRGRIALNFTRQASSALEAVTTAVSDVQRAIPDAMLIEATPDLVGLTDMADLLGFSRQNMRKLMESGAVSFPPPVHEGAPTVWRLAKVLGWFRERGTHRIDDALVELAQATLQINLVNEVRDLPADARKTIRQSLAGV